MPNLSEAGSSLRPSTAAREDSAGAAARRPATQRRSSSAASGARTACFAIAVNAAMS